MAGSITLDDIKAVLQIRFTSEEIESLIYWRDVKKSGIVFGAGLILLLAITCYSVISVAAYLSLILLTGAIAFRIYKTVLTTLQKTSDGHPFKEYLDSDCNLSQDRAQYICTVIVAPLNAFVGELRRLFLVADLVDSLKFGVILWVLTYVGSWFNGMTLLILAYLGVFSLPKVYEQNKQIIDQYLEVAKSKFVELTDKVKAAIPIGKTAPASEPAESAKDK